ncbi:MAG: LuxR C-terminal-related transcriptional regulator [bacterium]
MVLRAAPSLDERLPLARIKLRPPTLRAGVVERSGLVGRLLTSEQTRVVAIVAPCGYGKTTLMAQWRKRESRQVAWLSADRNDNDPATLLFHVAAALHCAGMVEPGRVSDVRLTSGPAVLSGVARLAGALAAGRSGGVLMLDNVENIRSRLSNDVVTELAARLPAGVQLAVASRTGVRLPAATLRAQGALLEVGAGDLAMDGAEAKALLDHMGVDVGDDLDALVRRTEGWPVALYLAALAVRSGSARVPPLQISGTDRYLADYLRHEVLDHLSSPRVSFLTRTSILERFDGPLCDAVLETAGSARTIERLEGSNLLIVPLDRNRSWYRYHHLLRDVLRAELARREPGIVPTLHVRAAEWFEANGMPEQAVEHAQATGDTSRVARVVRRVTPATFGSGRAETVSGWLRWFERRADQVGQSPDIAALGALVHALSGDEDGADRWTTALFATGLDADADRLPASGRLLRALLARGGTSQVRADARAARQAEEPVDREWLPAALLLEGFSHLWEADESRADAVLARAAAAGEWLRGLPAATSALAGRALVALRRDEWQAADELVTRSLKLIHQHGLHRYLTSGLPYAVATRCALRHGDLAGARRLLARATTVRPLLTTATPGISVQTLLEIATAHRELSDVAGTRVVLREASGILAKRSDLGVLTRQYDEIKSRLDAMATSAGGATALTAAELRLLPWLATYLSFPEIGEHLHVSRHTVKTQAMSIYRKLGASSRSEAVRRAGDLALLGMSISCVTSHGLAGLTNKESVGSHPTDQCDRWEKRCRVVSSASSSDS